MGYTFKLIHGDDVRRVTLEKLPSLEELNCLAQKMFRLASFQLKYRDEDEDLVTISSAMELEEAFRHLGVLAEGGEGKVVRIQVHDVNHLSQSCFVQPPQVREQQPMDLLASLLGSLRLPAASQSLSQSGSSMPLNDLLSMAGMALQGAGVGGPSAPPAEAAAPLPSLPPSHPASQPVAAAELFPGLPGASEEFPDPDVPALPGASDVKAEEEEQQQEEEEEAEAEAEAEQPEAEEKEPAKEEAAEEAVEEQPAVEQREEEAAAGGGKREPGIVERPMLATYKARFVRDVHVADLARFKPREDFVKVWLLANDGDVAWPEGTKLQWVAGDKLSERPFVFVKSAAPGEEVEVAMELKAPSRPGRYVSYFRMVSELGVRFGHRVWVDIIVEPMAPTNVPGLLRPEPSSPSVDSGAPAAASGAAPVASPAPVAAPIVGPSPGPAPAPAPVASSVVVPAKFIAQIKMLQGMGFNDVETCVQVLERCKGNLQAAIDELVEMS